MKILVFGELINDFWVYGRVERLCPEGPVPVINPTSETKNNGGAGNVVNNLRSLSNGEIHVDFIHQKELITKTRYVDKISGYLLLRVDENDACARIDWFERKIDFGSYDAIVVSDYDKGFLTEGDIDNISEEALFAKTPMFLDTKKILGNWSCDVGFVKINLREYLANLKQNKKPEHFCKNLIVTSGKDGSWWADRNITVPAPQVKIAEVSGCGDVWLAAFVLNYLAEPRANEEEAVRKSMVWANRAASFAASKPGVVAVNESDLVR